MSQTHEAHQTYVLRLWRAQHLGRWQWCASLESPRTGERQVFGALEQLYADIAERCASMALDTLSPPDHETR